MLLQLLRSGRGCVHPPDPAPGPPAELGVNSQRLELPGLLVLCPPACGRSAKRTPPRLPRPRPRRSPSGDRNMPRVWLLGLYSSASLSFHDPWEPLLRASSSFRLNRLSGRPEPQPPSSALGAPSRLFGIRLHRLPSPCPLSPGRQGSGRPWRCPFRTRHPPNLGWTPLRRALPPASLSPLRSCNLKAQLSTSGDFSLLSSL